MPRLSPRSRNTPLNREDAAHFVRRCGFGASPQEVDSVMKDGLEASIERFFELQAEPQTLQFLDQGIQRFLGAQNSEALASWWMIRMVLSPNPLFEKMTLFWHNHFATSDHKIQSPRLMYKQHQLFRNAPFGPFESLLQQVARDPAMIYWLDNNSNTKEQANENFARELMELFSLGIGNYQEKDIQEAARAFTGWFVQQKEFRFSPHAHDHGIKTIFGKQGAFQGEEVVHLCATHLASYRFIAQKLLRLFVHPQPDKALVETFGELLKDSNFDLKKPLQELFRSQVFFEPQNRGVLIRSPIDLIVGTLRSFSLKVDIHEAQQWASRMGQSLFYPPNVKGWEGDRTWINAATLLARQHFASRIATLVSEQEAFASDFDENNVSDLLDQLCLQLIPLPLPSPVRDRLLQYAKNTRETRKVLLVAWIEALLTLPEYHIA
jgi:uncharacterized protein (DUF1800 family)